MLPRYNGVGSVVFFAEAVVAFFGAHEVGQEAFGELIAGVAPGRLGVEIPEFARVVFQVVEFAALLGIPEDVFEAFSDQAFAVDFLIVGGDSLSTCSCPTDASLSRVGRKLTACISRGMGTPA